MAVSDNLFYVFDKADGAFLGKVKNEEMLGNDMHIEGMIKIDNNAFAIQYRTDMILNCNIKSDSHTEKASKINSGLFLLGKTCVF